MMLMQIKNSNDSLHSSLLRKPLGTLSLPFFLVKLILDNDTCRELKKKYCCEIHNVSMTSSAASSLKKCAWGGGEEPVTRVDLV